MKNNFKKLNPQELQSVLGGTVIPTPYPCPGSGTSGSSGSSGGSGPVSSSLGDDAGTSGTGGSGQPGTVRCPKIVFGGA